MPDFASLRDGKKARHFNHAKGSAFDIPARSIIELEGYLEILETARYYPRLHFTEGTRAHIRLHNISLEDTGPLVLQKGLHPITITITQESDKKGRVEIEWLKADSSGMSKAVALTYRHSFRH